MIFAEEMPSPLALHLMELAKAKGIKLQILVKQESPLLRPFINEAAEAVILGLPLRDADTPGETISLADANSLLQLIFLLLDKEQVR